MTSNEYKDTIKDSKLIPVGIKELLDVISNVNTVDLNIIKIYSELKMDEYTKGED